MLPLVTFAIPPSLAMPFRPRLVTWDIDGTLLRAGGPSGNQVHKRVIDEAVKATCAINTTVNDVTHAGCTDLAIIRSMCLHGGVPSSQISSHMPVILKDAADRMRRYATCDMSHLVLPGAIDALNALRERGVSQALVTGNFQAAAWAKINAAGLQSYFQGGAFGDEREHRTDILSLAMDRFGIFGPDVVHIGDAIADVQAAKDLGAGGVGVLTGAFGRSDLEVHEPLAVLEDLSDTTRFLKVLSLE